MTSSGIVSASLGVIVFCWFQNACFEQILQYDTNAGALVTFFQFLFLVIVETLKLSAKKSKRVIPVWVYVAYSAAYVAINKANNAALHIGVSLPMSTLYRSFSVAASVACGAFCFQKTYSKRQYLAASLVTGGIVLCTITDGRLETTDDQSRTNWVAGMALLSIAVLSSAILGHCQDMTYIRYTTDGVKPYGELMFYLHAMSLPLMFSMDYQTFSDQIRQWVVYGPQVELGLPVSKILLLVIGCVVGNYLGVRCVYAVSAMTSSVALNILLTTRKALTIVSSMILHGNVFCLEQWIGAIIVFVGAFLYATDKPESKEKKIH